MPVNTSANMPLGKRMMFIFGTAAAALVLLVLLLFMSAAAVKGAVLLLAQLATTDAALLWIQKNVLAAFGISFLLLCCFAGLTLYLLPRWLSASVTKTIRDTFTVGRHPS